MSKKKATLQIERVTLKRANKEEKELSRSDVEQCAARYVTRILEKDYAAPSELEAAVNLVNTLL